VLDDSLLESARRLGAMINASDGDMALVTGSVARGLSDQSSDIDLYVYRRGDVHAQPSLPPSEAKLLFAIPTRTGRFEKFRLGDRFVDIEQVHSTVLDTVWGRVKEGHIEPSDVTIGAGIRDAKALTGADALDLWQRRLTLTDRVATCEVRRLAGQLVSPRALYDLTWRRSDHLSYLARVSRVLLSGVGLLGAVNRRWVPTDEPKWMPWHIDQLQLTPPETKEGIQAGLTSPSEGTTENARILLIDILDLVDRHIGCADTRAARFALQLGLSKGRKASHSNGQNLVEFHEM